MPLISQNFLRWKTLGIMSYTKPWEANRIESGPVMAKVSSKYLFKFPGHYFIQQKQEYSPNFQSKGHSVGQKPQKEGSTSEK